VYKSMAFQRDSYICYRLINPLSFHTKALFEFQYIFIQFKPELDSQINSERCTTLLNSKIKCPPEVKSIVKTLMITLFVCR